MLRHMLLVTLILSAPGIARAGIETGNSAVVVNAGYAFGKLAASGQSADGNAVSITFEHVGAPGRTAGFFSIGYGKISDDENDGSGVVTRSVETLPIYLGVKGYFGEGNVQFHVGLAFGTYFSTVVSSGKLSGEDWTSWSTTGFGMGFPIGLTFCLGETVFLNGEYILSWTWTNEALQGDILNAVALGLGFRWGG